MGRATVNLSINWPSSSTTPSPATNSPMEDTQSTTVTSIPRAPSPEIQSLDHDLAVGPPVYKMSRGIKTVTNLWVKWLRGIGGGYAVHELERRWGTKWRNDDRKYFSCRIKIIQAIESYAAIKGISEEVAAGIAERSRVSLGESSLAYLNENTDVMFEE